MDRDRSRIVKGMIMHGGTFPAIVTKSMDQPVRYGEEAPTLDDIAKKIERARRKIDVLRQVVKK